VAAETPAGRWVRQQPAAAVRAEAPRWLQSRRAGTGTGVAATLEGRGTTPLVIDGNALGVGVCGAVGATTDTGGGASVRRSASRIAFSWEAIFHPSAPPSAPSERAIAT
jgi:hypothetical protein